MEPILVMQTAEREHWEKPLDWWKDANRKAVATGATWSRYSWDDEHKALLAEFWKDRPDEQGAQRWAFS